VVPRRPDTGRDEGPRGTSAKVRWPSFSSVHAAARGCVALIAFPLLACAAPVVAWRRRAAVRRRGNELTVKVTRGCAAGVSQLRCEIGAPAHRLGEVATAIGGAVAECAHAVGRTVGCVGIVSGEEPVLVALAPARDIVAERVRETLERGQAHRRPELWLTLPAGRYLAQVIDPYAPFSGDHATVSALVGSGAAEQALRADLAGNGVALTFTLTLHARRAALRKLFTLARTVLADLPGWTATR
jgi:hypothetical protein